MVHGNTQADLNDNLIIKHHKGPGEPAAWCLKLRTLSAGLTQGSGYQCWDSNLDV